MRCVLATRYLISNPRWQNNLVIVLPLANVLIRLDNNNKPHFFSPDKDTFIYLHSYLRWSPNLVDTKLSPSTKIKFLEQFKLLSSFNFSWPLNSRERVGTEYVNENKYNKTKYKLYQTSMLFSAFLPLSLVMFPSSVVCMLLIICVVLIIIKHGRMAECVVCWSSAICPL